ncbi:MAG: Phenylacetate-coenzyme A ligase [Syntrophorhabdus sp. PtaU1.Bin153]|nr:MAG: Phenylacetate-coenzyme A ligase [Syntrophorhabdus sp. PtaU1.Bin153]
MHSIKYARIGSCISKNKQSGVIDMEEEHVRIDWTSEKMSRDDILKFQQKRLKALLNRAWEHVPFYRRIWKEHGFSPDQVKSVEDIIKVPFITKKDIADSMVQFPPFGDYQGDFPVIRVQASTGSTGKPKPIFHTRNDWENITSLWARRLSAQGIGSKDIVQIAFAYTLFIVGFTSTEGVMKTGAMVVPTGSGAVTPSERQLQTAHDWGVTAFGCTGSYMLRLADVAKKMGFDTKRDFKVRVSFHTAEPLTEEMRTDIEKIWGCRAYNNYGSVETGAPTFECEHQDGLHISEDAYIFEIIDPVSGKPVADGEEGELVATTLFKEAAPLIRYRIGDIAAFIPGECGCGRTFRRMSSIRGRVDDMIKVKGVAVYPTDFEPSIKQSGLFGSEYLIKLWKEGQRELVKVLVDFHGEEGDLKSSCEALSADLHKALGLRCEVEVLPRDQIEKLLDTEKRTKYKRILDLRK